MAWVQKKFTLKRYSKGCHLITDEVLSHLPEIKQYRVGLLHLFCCHTSAGLTIQENWDSDVRKDMTDILDKLVPEDGSYRHNAEGSDDAVSHAKTLISGHDISLPITNGSIAVGTWQGIWLCEYRRQAHTRTLVATIQGERMS